MIYLLVASVDPDSAAERAGLRVGDFLTDVNGVEMSSNAALARELTRLASGRTARINRDGQDIDISLPDGRLGMLTEDRAFDLSAARRTHAAAHLVQSVTMATLDAIDGRRIERVLGVLTAEYAAGMNIIKDVMVGGRDLFGGRSQESRNLLRMPRPSALPSSGNRLLIWGQTQYSV